MLTDVPLVLFTVFSQMSVGAFVVLGFIQLAGARVDPKIMDRISDPVLYAIGPTLTFGLLASILHLGSPIRAANSLRHLESSWLSREIVIGIVFAALGGAFALVQWRKMLTPRWRQVLAMATAVAGLLLVWATSRVYTLRTVPAWDTWHTTLSFFVTTFLLGALAVGAALVITARIRARRGEVDEVSQRIMVRAIRGIAISSIVVLGVSVVALPAYLGGLATHPSPAAAESLNLLAATYGGFSLLQVLLVFTAVALLGFFVVQLARGRITQRGLAVAVVSAFALAFTGEIIGRTLFYASMVRIGM